MKELSVEEKAKRYDKAIGKARKLYNSEETSADVEIACENIFPELKESEEEKIRKELIHYFTEGIEFLSLCSVSREQILAWLEKHGEPMEINPNEFELRLNRLLKQFESLPKEELIDSLSFYLNVVQNNGTYKPDEKQDEQETLCNKCKKEQPSHSCQDITELGRCAVEHEQKSADKVEPKFNVGDWCRRRNGGFLRPIKITKVLPFSYEAVDDIGYHHSIEKDCFENNFYLWTIHDAKEGDVLISKGELKYSNGIKYERICLFNNLDKAFFTLVKTSNNVETYDIDVNIDYPDNTVPATKEQREILFMAMTDAGYTFDFEKKKLKKIEK